MIIITIATTRDEPGPNGWAAIIRTQTRSRTMRGGDSDTTPGRMALVAAIESIRSLPSGTRATLVSESRRMIRALTSGWIVRAAGRGFVSEDDSPVSDSDLWAALLAELATRDITFELIRPGSGIQDGKRAVAAARKSVPATARRWTV